MESKALEKLPKSVESEPETNEEMKNPPLATYDPKKKYRWESETKFLLSGEEFGVILNSLRAILGSPDAQKILLANKANEAIENSLARAVQIGIVYEDTKK